MIVDAYMLAVDDAIDDDGSPREPRYRIPLRHLPTSQFKTVPLLMSLMARTVFLLLRRLQLLLVLPTILQLVPVVSSLLLLLLLLL